MGDAPVGMAKMHPKLAWRGFVRHSKSTATTNAQPREVLIGDPPRLCSDREASGEMTRAALCTSVIQQEVPAPSV